MKIARIAHRPKLERSKTVWYSRNTFCLFCSLLLLWSTDHQPFSSVAHALSPRRTKLITPKRHVNQNLRQQLSETPNDEALSPRSPLHMAGPSDSETTTSPVTTQQQKQHPSRSRQIVVAFSSTLLLLTIVSAKIGLLPATLDGMPYTNAALLRDVGATLLTGTLGYLLVKGITIFTNIDGTRSGLDPRDSRKLVHTLSAPLFIVFWPLFSSGSVGARVFAATVPLINAVRLYVSATGTQEDDRALAMSVSRSGDRLEAAGGPLIYVLVLATCILLFWRDDPAGVVALSAMAAGDGVADLVGRRYGGSNPWPTAITGPDNRKSVAGTAAFLVASVCTSWGLLVWLQRFGCLAGPLPGGMELLGTLTVICGVAAMLELVPVADDNYTVPLSAAILSVLLLR